MEDREQEIDVLRVPRMRLTTDDLPNPCLGLHLRPLSLTNLLDAMERGLRDIPGRRCGRARGSRDARLVQDPCVRRPLIVVVTGMPASGKTTLAEPLSRDLALPLLARDRIKERLYDTLGVGDLAWSARLGGAAFALLFDFARVLIESGDAAILEANFFRGTEPQFFELPEHRVVQIHCEAPLDLLLARYTKRPRHQGHHDSEKGNELAIRFRSGVHEPLDLPGDLIRVDTSQPVDLDAIAARVRGRV